MRKGGVMKRKMDFKNRIEQVLSSILSDKHECKIIIKFEKKGN